MMGGKKPQLGFTVVETLIVLAVSSVIFFSATLLISGRISRTEFTQAIQDIQSKTLQRINEVTNGFYANNGNITCIAGLGGPNISESANGQGTNEGCTFIGKAIQFSVRPNPSQYNIYTVAALRESSPGIAATDLTSAKPVLIASGNNVAHSTFPNEFDQQTLQSGLTTVGMYYNGNSANQIGTVVFMSSLGTQDANNNLISGAQNVSLYALQNTRLNRPKLNEVDQIDRDLSSVSTALQVNSVQVCFKSGGTNQSALMNIGTSNSTTLATTIIVKSSSDCS